MLLVFTNTSNTVKLESYLAVKQGRDVAKDYFHFGLIYWYIAFLRIWSKQTVFLIVRKCKAFKLSDIENLKIPILRRSHNHLHLYKIIGYSWPKLATIN